MPAMSPDDPVLLDVDDGIATITLNRPGQLNTATGGLLAGLGAAYARVDADDEVRVVIVTGAGRAFCAGADFSPGSQPFAAPDVTDAAPRRFESSPIRPRAWEVRKPVIAAINGHAIGIGFTIAMQCDFRFIAADAKWGIVQTRRGVLPDAQSHWTVARAVGFARAAEILIAGKTFRGHEAAELGIVNAALPADEVLAAARALAADIRTNVNPLSAALSKRILWQAEWASADAIDALEREAHLVLMGRPDAIEGPRAFMERRAPEWQSRVPADWPADSDLWDVTRPV
jgi:enoyl-CoA hydratase/carnithine racemase